MIVWLASYPRSGNTLARTILYQCFGYGSYNLDLKLQDNTYPADRLPSAEMQQYTGMLLDDRGYDRFYREATRSKELHIVKTHMLPPDSQPAIYVHRDGRTAAMSYLEFQQEIYPGERHSLLAMILGDDYHGPWSGHVESWTRRHGGPTLELRFSDLLDVSDTTLQAMADFIGYQGEIRPWKNPIDKMREQMPWLVRTGKPGWQMREPWNEYYDALFHVVHGDTMKALGYYDRQEAEQLDGHPMLPMVREHVDYIRELHACKSALHGNPAEQQGLLRMLGKFRAIRLYRMTQRLGRRQTSTGAGT